MTEVIQARNLTLYEVEEKFSLQQTLFISNTKNGFSTKLVQVREWVI